MSPVFQQTFYGALGDFSSRSTDPRGNTLSGLRSLVTSRSLVWFRVLKVIRNTINTDKDGLLSTRVVQYAMIFFSCPGTVWREEKTWSDQKKQNNNDRDNKNDKWQKHFENTLKEQSCQYSNHKSNRLLVFDIFLCTRFTQRHKWVANPWHRTSCLYLPPGVHLLATGASHILEKKLKQYLYYYNIFTYICTTFIQEDFNSTGEDCRVAGAFNCKCKDQYLDSFSFHWKSQSVKSNKVTMLLNITKCNAIYQ